ncbi:MAG: phage holin [Eubacteriales bacterium]|nr:phage holin [Eubacteriales bacterium]
MKINWKLRFKSPVFVTSFLSLVLSFVYNLLGMFEIVPAISHEAAVNGVLVLVQVLTGLGILIDPTTKGVSDCKAVMCSDTPRE